MEIGYIYFGQKEKEDLYRVLQAIRTHQAIDELGIGRVRDAFSNRMFPGMSVLQSRAKYFALLPSIYKAAAQRHYSNVGEVRRTVIDMEIALTRRLSEGSRGETGIIGGEMLASANRFVKYDPTYIYAGGLATYGMVRSGGNIYRIIFEMSRRMEDNPRRRRRREGDDEPADADELTGDMQLFDTGGLGYDFAASTPLSIMLTDGEAAFIRHRILSSPASKDSLLAYLLSHKDVRLAEDFQDLDALWTVESIGKHHRTYELSARFARFVYLLRLFYNHLFYQLTGNCGEAEILLSEYEEYLDGHREDFTLKQMEQTLQHIGGEVKDEWVKAFCREAAQCVERDDRRRLAEIIVRQEKRIKGGRAKLSHPAGYMGKLHAKAEMLDYRWNTVYKMIDEIRGGTTDGKE